MIRRHQQTEKESLILVSPCRLRGQLDEGTEKGVVMKVMVKYLVDLEKTAMRREVIRIRLGLRGTVVGREGAGMRKGGDAAADLASLEFETHASRLKFLEIEAAAVQAHIDTQESVGVSKPNVEPPCHTTNR